MFEWKDQSLWVSEQCEVWDRRRLWSSGKELSSTGGVIAAYPVLEKEKKDDRSHSSAHSHRGVTPKAWNSFHSFLRETAYRWADPRLSHICIFMSPTLSSCITFSGCLTVKQTNGPINSPLFSQHNNSYKPCKFWGVSVAEMTCIWPNLPYWFYILKIRKHSN